ncbi:WYL domain-containing protein [Alkalimonas sp. NCh-2]|uniref:Predicted DNA-binding transcriptional regulator YafY, contains an HTH and WYL domains n=1 Tax=Alkalimonas amylolytica TaxID=152573 RepID=A0A1H3YG79_ALKAM|nr:WYL domain-containing protein [Alkalimonas amylolytica]SEA10599.1 Predicted DNA-binding transcriptional regulator YafY, contains an HTH and WYL domains [Alkalimonas amylolytica]
MPKQNSNIGWPIRWELLMRYRLIEIVALWEGRLTTNHLCNSFGIARQQASKDINAYKRDVGPGNLVYDSKLKGYKPSDNFTPKVTSGLTDEYLHALASIKDFTHTFSQLDLGFAHTEMLTPPLRQVNPDILRALVQAARDGNKIDMSYVSLTSPDEESRIIAPHTLVCTPLRWHMRAYCEKNRDFRDFVLSRFRGINGIEGDAEMTKEQDERWNNKVDIVLVPDSRLSAYQKAIIAEDYNMVGGKRVISVRSALVPYAVQALNLDLAKIEARPEAQQIMVANLEEVKLHAF